MATKLCKTCNLSKDELCFDITRTDKRSGKVYRKTTCKLCGSTARKAATKQRQIAAGKKPANPIINNTRMCNVCDVMKPLDEFYKAGKTNYFGNCKECYNHSVAEKSRIRRLSAFMDFDKCISNCIEGFGQRTRKRQIKFPNMENPDPTITVDYIRETYYFTPEVQDFMYHAIVTGNKKLAVSIDRIDDSRGYVKDNIRITTRLENWAKNGRSRKTK